MQKLIDTLSINRTILECKVRYWRSVVSRWRSINRTILEGEFCSWGQVLETGDKSFVKRA